MACVVEGREAGVDARLVVKHGQDIATIATAPSKAREFAHGAIAALSLGLIRALLAH